MPKPPNSSSALARRIKRQAWAPSHPLFAVTAPGLEELCAAEMANLGLMDIDPQPGGVAFTGRFQEMYRANLGLRTAGRILLRLADFRVRNWEDLVRQAGRIPWELYLPGGASLSLRVSLVQSNLRHEGRVAEVIGEAVEKTLREYGLEPPKPAPPGDETCQTVMVRGVDRRAMISLDTSGVHLHKRGYRLASGKAPLREDLAAALLMLSGYDGRQTLLDPMCGAGTLPIEAAMAARGMAPGLGRAFAMEEWPSHREAMLEHLKKENREALRPVPAPILGRDRLGSALDLARQNAARAGLDQSAIAWEPGDFLKAPAPPLAPESQGLVVMNPPYGKRLGSVRQAADLLEQAGRRLLEAYSGWRAGVVLYRPEWRELLPLKQTKSLVVPHGGVTVTLLTGTVL